MKKFTRIFTVLVFLFLYLPMIVLGVASFNKGTDIASWSGFTLKQYGALFRDGTLLPLLGNSVIVAVVAAVIKPQASGPSRKIGAGLVGGRSARFSARA